MREDPSSSLFDWHHVSRRRGREEEAARLTTLFAQAGSWPAIAFMAGQPSRVPPPHQPLDAVAGASNRPKPLWQPWSDSDG